MRAAGGGQETGNHLEGPKDSEFHLCKIPIPTAALAAKISCQSRSLSSAQLSDARVERVWN